MAFSHLINCVLLAYGPYFVVYKGKNLENHRVIYGLLLSSLAFFVTQAFKMILLSLIIPASAQMDETIEYDFYFVLTFLQFLKHNFQDIKKNLFNIIDFIGIYMMLKYRWSQADDILIRCIVLGLGWSLTDSICSNLFTFIMNASGDELNWNYMFTALMSNFEFLEIICCVAIAIQTQIILRNQQIKQLFLQFFLLFFIIAKFCVLPTIIQLQKLIFIIIFIRKQIYDNDGVNLIVIAVKGTFSLTLLGFVYFKKYFKEK